MNIALDRFCINRKIAPNLNLDHFFRLVKRCGLSKVELRNDMPSGKVTTAAMITRFQPMKVNIARPGMNSLAWQVRCTTW